MKYFVAESITQKRLDACGVSASSSLSRNNDLLKFRSPVQGRVHSICPATCLYDKSRFKLCKRRAHVAEVGGNGRSHVPDPGDASQRNKTDEQGVLDQILTAFAALQAL
jgi:hypothetical protein